MNKNLLITLVAIFGLGFVGGAVAMDQLKQKIIRRFGDRYPGKLAEFCRDYAKNNYGNRGNRGNRGNHEDWKSESQHGGKNNFDDAAPTN